MTHIAKFLRADGIEMSAAVGSPSFDLMEKDGSFMRVYTEAESIAQLGESERESVEKTETAPAAMKRGELIEFANARGIEINPKMKTVDILAVVEEALAAEAETETE